MLFILKKKRNNIGLLLCTCICCGCWYVFACHIVKLQLYALDVDLYIWRQGWQHDRSFSGLHVSSVVDDFWYSGHSTPVQHDSSSVQVNHPRWHPQQTGGQRKRVSHSWQFCWLAPLNWIYSDVYPDHPFITLHILTEFNGNIDYFRADLTVLTV